MWTAPPPPLNPTEVWTSTLENISPEERSNLLVGATERVAAANAAFVVAAATGSCRDLKVEDFQLGKDGASHTTWLYKNRLARGSQRSVYDEIKTNIVDDVCPYCHHRDTYDLDHFLPKESFHLLAVSPWNLVPCCKECNFNKLAHSPDIASNEFFHPYFETLTGAWLTAEIIPGPRPSVKFRVTAPQSWSLTTRERAEFQFDRLKLDKLYRSQSAAELRALAGSLPRLYRQKEGANRVHLKLLELSRERRSLGPNDWKLALLKAMADSDWYCDGGFMDGMNLS